MGLNDFYCAQADIELQMNIGTSLRSKGCLTIMKSFVYVNRFTVWAVLFVLGRLLTLSLSVLTVGFGLAGAEKQGLNIAEGSFNVLFVR